MRPRPFPAIQSLRLYLPVQLFSLKITQFSIRRLLEKNGYWVTVAENGKEALVELAQDQYDCVLMFVLMPVIEVVEATRRIRVAEDRNQRTEDRS